MVEAVANEGKSNNEGDNHYKEWIFYHIVPFVSAVLYVHPSRVLYPVVVAPPALIRDQSVSDYFCDDLHLRSVVCLCDEKSEALGIVLDPNLEEETNNV